MDCARIAERFGLFRQGEESSGCQPHKCLTFGEGLCGGVVCLRILNSGEFGHDVQFRIQTLK